MVSHKVLGHLFLFANVKCIFLGYTYGRAGNLGFSKGTGPILLGYLYCSGTESNLVMCNQNYKYTHIRSGCQNHNYDGAVICECKL